MSKRNIARKTLLFEFYKLIEDMSDWKSAICRTVLASLHMTIVLRNERADILLVFLHYYNVDLKDVVRACL